MVPFWREAFVLSEAQTGALLAAMNGGQILSMIPLGTAIDRYGERVVVGVTMLAMSAVSFAIGHFVDSYVGLLFGRVALGAFYASVQPGGTRAILKWFPPSERGFAMGIRQSGLPLGTAAAALLLPALAISAGWRNVTLVQAGIGMAGALLFLALHRDRDLPQCRSSQPRLDPL
ncbi:MFS transporter, partial [Bradyrhizobium sp.]|uniref:MFS transporter n=1 Tax=Bradyrhizobium sp. TaxID=376 RepID=UPI002913D29E